MAEPTSALARPDGLSTLNSWAWLDATADGLVAFLLAVPGTPDVTENDIASLAAALGAAGPRSAMPSIGPRISLREMIVTLHIPEIGRAIAMEVTDEWRLLVQRGGTVVCLLGAEPLPNSAAMSDLREYIGTCIESDQLWLGKTSLQLSPEQADLTACLVCSTDQRPFHPGPALPRGEDVVRDTVLCTRCLASGGIDQ